MSISSSAVLVELNISVWPAAKVDREMTEIVNVSAEATPGAAQIKKNLFAGTSLRKDIEKFAARVRLYHNLHTLPWADKGERLLPTKLFMDYKQQMNDFEQQFNAMCEAFFDNYHHLVAQAPLHMGSMYRADDYPSLEDVRLKFSFRRSVKPLPDSGDFRLDIPAADVTELRAEYDKQYQEKLADAMRAPWERLHDMLTGMSAKLGDDNGDGKKRYHDTFLTNAQELCSMLTKMNITNDPKLEAARRQLELTLLGADVETIKESAIVRSTIKRSVDSILNKFEW